MICLIPARGGSRRIKRKNIKEFHGKPIIAYSIDLALKSELFNQVVVSTEDDEIAEISEKYGATVHHREEGLEHNDVGTQEVAQEAFSLLPHDDYACVLYATSPFLMVRDLKKGIETLKNWPSFDYCYSVDHNGKDAGNFYFGRTTAFLEGRSLKVNSIHIHIPVVLDINTPEDWKKAVEMYD